MRVRKIDQGELMFGSLGQVNLYPVNLLVFFALQVLLLKELSNLIFLRTEALYLCILGALRLSKDLQMPQ